VLRLCPTCKGIGAVELTGAYGDTLAAILALGKGAETTGVELARTLGVAATAVNNRLAAIERLGLLVSRRDGCRRLYRIPPLEEAPCVSE
jgi:biotin operon repressor